MVGTSLRRRDGKLVIATGAHLKATPPGIEGVVGPLDFCSGTHLLLLFKTLAIARLGGRVIGVLGGQPLGRSASARAFGLPINRDIDPDTLVGNFRSDHGPAAGGAVETPRRVEPHRRMAPCGVQSDLARWWPGGSFEYTLVAATQHTRQLRADTDDGPPAF